MKFLVTFCVIICVVGAFSIEDDSYPKRPPKFLIYQCTLINNIDEDMMTEILKSKSFSKTEDTQCFAACLMDKSGIIIAGEKNEDFVNSAAGKECQSWSGENNCEIASNMLNCLFQKRFIALN